ncbi:hypothetical protein ACQ4LE_001511 [Meloidogyne hapla]|uniref:Protein hunchback n=1 Tax=Meloidogyne hapla TaxID=6305 RepID=A0A1I8AZB9_MELHA
MLSNIARPTPVSAADLGSTPQNHNISGPSVEDDSIQTNQSQQKTSRTYFRPPGLGPDSGECPDDVKVCPHCGFSCSSQFHYNSHMNTHTIQQCVICDFQSRTQGRLKKHIQHNHTPEERLAAGILNSTPSTARNNNIPPTPPTPTQTNNNSPMSVNNNEKIGNIQNEILNNLNTSEGTTLMETNKLESLQSILNNNTLTQQFSNSTDALLKICTDAISNNGPNEKSFNSPQIGDLGPTAFDQFRALAERQAANLLATSTANSLGFVGDVDQEMALVDDGSEISPEEYHQQNNNSKQPETSTTTTTNNRRAGKPKQYKCKQCPHLSHSKKEQWAHARLHIPKQKQLCCDICDFVTEYKHHLEYHYRNHNGQKPFKCSTCAYTCVNKSMLNSHMKSHTPNFQHKCQDCTYQTKYGHSLKMHLRKYNHKCVPGTGGELFDSSDSHGEGAVTPAIGDRPENASSSSASKEESFEIGNHQNYLAKSDDLALLKSPSTPHHDLVVQPLVNNPELDLASQHHFILQQQIEQMHELICNAVVNCPHCNFSTGNIDEMNQHLFLHLIATHQQMPQQIGNEQEALASIYHRLTTQLHQELIPPPSDTPSSTLLSQELPAAAAALQITQETEENNVKEENNQNKYLKTPTNNNMDISSVKTPPTSSSNNNELFGFNNGEENILIQQQNEDSEGIAKPIPSSQHGLFSPSLITTTNFPINSNDILSNFGASPSPSVLINNNNDQNLLNSDKSKYSNEQNNDSISSLPFYCQQCDIAFRDAVLYQLHRGYHSIENPFKCNRCGQISNTALEFNLHLYQAKHE